MSTLQKTLDIYYFFSCIEKGIHRKFKISIFKIILIDFLTFLTLYTWAKIAKIISNKKLPTNVFFFQKS